jgi:hypothetical protein
MSHIVSSQPHYRSRANSLLDTLFAEVTPDLKDSICGRGWTG